jgi:hypothetical protein
MTKLLRSVVALLLVLLPGLAEGGPNADAKILLHLAAPTARNACSRRPACASTVTYGLSLYPLYYFAYVLVGEAAQATGASGVSFGIQYNSGAWSGLYMHSWHLCADAESPTAGWPASGTGNTVSWNSETNCQRTEPGGAGTGVVATAGYFNVSAYTPVQLFLTPNPATGTATVTTCTGITDVIAPPDTCHQLSSLGFAGFGGMPGFRPCYISLGSCPCQITGPPICAPGSTGNRYARASYDPGSLFWSISGNGVIDSTSGAAVWVTAGAVGTFTLHLRIDHPDWWDVDCEKVVTVEDNIPTRPTTWGGIKALYR